METAADEMERAYLGACNGDAREALRRAIGDALVEITSLTRDVSCGFVRAGKPADLARKLGRERRACEAAR